MELGSGGMELLTQTQPLPGTVFSLPEASTVNPDEIQAQIDDLIWSNGEMHLQKNTSSAVTPAVDTQTIAVDDAMVTIS